MKTIAAIATPIGKGGISVIRLSGDRARELMFAVTTLQQNIKPREMNLCNLRLDLLSDKILCVLFTGPNSYTGEDVAEFHIHGSIVIANKLMEKLISLGAALAPPGEFSKRAFLNGKMDLTEAEAVMDLIEAESERAGINAGLAAEGGLFKEINNLQQSLIRVIASAEVCIDYPEELLEEQTLAEIEEKINKLITKIDLLIESYDTGKKIKNGVTVAIAGKPNVGKSQLLNALTGSDRAIVTAIAGTTRDTIEDSYEFKGVLFNMVDTAGLRETKEEIEAKGIDRSLKAIIKSDIVLSVREAGEEFCDMKARNIIYVENKIDKVDAVKRKNYRESCGDINSPIEISAKDGINIDGLKMLIHTRSIDDVSAGKVLITNHRHYAALCEAKKALELSVAELYISPLDCDITRLNDAYRALGEVTGVTANAEIVNAIFDGFCVGK